ncbi:DUF1629 domain-containing protein [uncultured Microscilla sp.]|uniref:imm11 family protein n=1 Tax=uncultured Microscilla sp. TaxID=432653 RepID=UPI002627C41E|nr:DUF1629 domain-containing protein [uncultured Microscilla sp.]
MKKVDYLLLKHSTNLKEIGFWEQLDVPEEYYNVPNNFKILEYDKFPEVSPNLENFRLREKANLTDCLSSFMPTPSIGFFISKKFQGLFNDFLLEGIRFYPTTIMKADGTTIDSYSFLHVVDQYHDNINYEKSVFVDFSEDDEPEVDIKEEDKIFLPDCVEPRKIILKNEVDLFRCPYDTSTLVSTKLKSTIEQEGITGVEFDDRVGIEFYLDE